MFTCGFGRVHVKCDNGMQVSWAELTCSAFLENPICENQARAEINAAAEGILIPDRVWTTATWTPYIHPYFYPYIVSVQDSTAQVTVRCKRFDMSNVKCDARNRLH